MGSEQRNALIAVVLSGLILFGWQYYFAPPKAPVAAPTETVQTPVNTGNQTVSTAETKTDGPIEPAQNETYTIQGGGSVLTFNNFLSVEDFQSEQAAFKFDATVGVQEPFKTELDFGQGFNQVSFAKTETANKFYNAQHDVTAMVSVSDKGIVEFKLLSPNAFKYRFVFKSEEKKLENNQERKFAYYTDELNAEKIGVEDEGDKAIKWAGIDFNYHLFATYFEKPQDLIFRMKTDKSFSLFANKNTNEVTYNLAFVKKEYNFLNSLGHNMKNSVDFGIWGFFAVWILKGLQFFYTFIPNYGVSIILLTLLIRMITFPLQYKSFVSMKKLQLIQPELTKIREKFKDDPQRLQKESMELFKKSGANPIGGCLPLLLQMPVFFAFYKVLYSAVELVDAPFILWLHDLSNKDPYYVLPVLMTVAMFLQQKLTPNTITDPVQKKVMMFMPLIFGFIMKDLPSGLSLYIFVSTLFGILQQLFVFQKKTNPVVV